MAIINLNFSEPFEQDNKPYKKFIGIIYPDSGLTTTNTEIVDAINSATFNVSSIEIPFLEVIVQVERNNTGVLQHRLYAHSKGKGYYGNGNYQGTPRIPVVYEDLFIIKETFLADDTTEELGGEIINLGNVGSLTVEDAVNLSSTTYDLESNVIYFIKILRNGIDETYLYIGETPATIGVGETPVTEDDFNLLDANSVTTTINQNNFSRSINIAVEDLSGIGTIEEQLAEYINNLNYTKQETDADIWIITDEEIESGSGGSGNYYEPVNRVGNEIYDITNTDDKKYIYLTGGNTIRLGEILANNFDSYLRNSTGETVVINNSGSDVFLIPTNKIASIPAGEEIRIRKDISGNYIITGNLTDSSSVEESTVVNITGNVTLGVGHHKKALHINNGSTDITITVPSQAGAEYKVGFVQLGTGNVDFIADNTIINSINGLRLQGQGYSCFLTKDSTGDYNLLGNLISNI